MPTDSHALRLGTVYSAKIMILIRLLWTFVQDMRVMVIVYIVARQDCESINMNISSSRITIKHVWVRWRHYNNGGT